jgi:hypothetical protein
MDDILDPADQEELGRKIEASPFATELIHRSRDAVRRLRLSAPEPLASDSDDLHGADHNLDANTAAEYLDNTLSPDEVAEFERTCLEAGPQADMLLAEAASCHHILTLVLGEPAEVDGDLRQRMYGLLENGGPQQARVEPVAQGAHHAPAVEPGPASAVAATMAAPAAPATRRPQVDPDEAAVPDYILEAARVRRRKNRQLVAMMVVAAGLGAVVAYLLWQPEPKLPSGVAEKDVDEATSGFVVGDGQQVGATATAGNETEAASAESGGDAPLWTPPATTGITEPAPIAKPDDLLAGSDASAAVGAEAAATGSAGDATPGDAATPEPPVEGETDAGTTEAGDAATAAADLGNNIPVFPYPGDDADSADNSATSADAGATAPSVPPPIPTNPNDIPPGVGDADQAAMLADAGRSTASTEDAVAGAGAADDLTNSATAPADAPPTDAAADQTSAAQPKQLGAYLGLNNDLLLRFEPSVNAWVRLPPRSTFAAGDRLLVLPAFRTLAVLGADVNAFLGGGTELTVGGSVGAEDVRVELLYGRVILNSGVNGNQIALYAGDQIRQIKLGPSSSLAVEARRIFVPGSNPDQDVPPLEINWYLTSGSADWGDSTDAAAAHSAEGPAFWTTIDGVDVAPQAIDELPEWIDKEPISNIEADARDAIAEKLKAGQPVNVALLELTGTTGLGRRIEVRALAARSGAYVGEFEPVVKALADPNERAKRKEQVETLRNAIARNPEAAKQIYDAFALQRGEEAAADLMEMLIGFNPAMLGTTREEVQNGSMVRLIQWLNDEDLTYRVLASHNLNEITATSYLGGYRPEHAAQARTREIRYYTDRFGKGELMPTEWTPTGWSSTR